MILNFLEQFEHCDPKSLDQHILQSAVTKARGGKSIQTPRQALPVPPPTQPTWLELTTCTLSLFLKAISLDIQGS